MHRYSIKEISFCQGLKGVASQRSLEAIEDSIYIAKLTHQMKHVRKTERDLQITMDEAITIQVLNSLDSSFA